VALAAAFRANSILSLEEVVNALKRDGRWAADDEAADFRVRYLTRADPSWLMGNARWDQLDFWE